MRLSFVSAFAVLVVPAAVAAQPYTLRFNPEPDTLYRQRFSSSQKISQTMMGQTIETKNRLVMDTHSRVLTRTPEGNFVLETTFDRVRVDMDAMGVSLSIDTDNPATGKNPMLGDLFGAMTGQKITVTMNDLGEVQSFSGIEEMMREMMEGTDADPATMAMMQQVVEAQANPEVLKEAMGFDQMVFPQNPVNVGDSWTHTRTAGAPFPMTQQVTYTLKSVGAESYIVEARLNLATEGGATHKVAGTEASMDLTGETVSTMRMDRLSGMLMDMEGTSTIAGTVKVEAGTQPMEIPMEIRQTFEVVSRAEK